MIQVLLVALGGALGSVGRYAVGAAAARVFGHGLPWGTLIVNVAMGFLAARIGPSDDNLRLLLGVGVLGGFTTFSAFSLEMVRLMEREPSSALLYAFSSLIFAVGACWVGLMLGRP